jgi:hypothetical protein
MNHNVTQYATNNNVLLKNITGELWRAPLLLQLWVPRQASKKKPAFLGRKPTCRTGTARRNAQIRRISTPQL